MRYLFWLVGIWQQLTRLLDPVNDSRMVNFGDSFNATKAHTVDIHPQTVSSLIIAISPMSFGIFYKLTTTINADVVLLAALMTVLANMFRLAFRAFHDRNCATTSI